MSIIVPTTITITSDAPIYISFVLCLHCNLIKWGFDFMDREEEVELIMGLVVVLVPVGSQHYRYVLCRRSRIGRSCDGEDGTEQEEEEEEEKEGEGEKTET
ncbi:hypothetical protein HID58_056412 [Brassica napus]|uniref:Uncharacterized protein n=1 Tax=Brassica napus TaxID=3708 RepID=A0ABQ8ANK0_BRANA|nr:hypothetical protein HID58_056412 [Brassica napus]